MKHFGYDSVSDAYGPMTGNQYNIVSRVWDGEDVRTMDINHTSTQSLIALKIISVDGDCRLHLMRPKEIMI